MNPDTAPCMTCGHAKFSHGNNYGPGPCWRWSCRCEKFVAAYLQVLPPLPAEERLTVKVTVNPSPMQLPDPPDPKLPQPPALPVPRCSFESVTVMLNGQVITGFRTIDYVAKART